PGRVRKNGKVDRGKPAGMRDFSYPDALSGHAPLSTAGCRGPDSAQTMGVLRHGSCRLSAAAYVTGAVSDRLRLVLPAALFPSIDLAPPSRGPECGAALFGHVVSVQALQSRVALADSASPH